jgi:hypothetical protein
VIRRQLSVVAPAIVVALLAVVFLGPTAALVVIAGVGVLLVLAAASGRM